MATALYRRYRPESFADVIGQEHVTEPLMQALRTGRVNHAYLFSGPRGCGKTTSARILARCLNCDQGPTPTPCGTCDSCVALSRGGPGSVDVIEIDAASHGGVDDARDLRERASYGPAQSRYKIYIIDEAHMVTPQGFNALLKIVEEPPEHVKFVFATTEPEKVIGTIRSRTHHYPFRLVPPAKLTAYMERLIRAEGIAAAPGVLSFVTRAGGGSVRDSLSVLDQLIAGSGPEGLTYEGAVSLLGFTDGELLDATIDALAAGDGAATFRQIDKVIESGHDPRRFIEDLLERLRDLIIVAAVPDGAAQVLRGVPEDQLERMRVQQAGFGPGALSRAADIANAGLTEMTGATAPRLQLELICARILLPASSGEQGYGARLDRLERRLEVGGVPSAAPSTTPPSGRMPLGSPPQPPTVPAPDPSQASAQDEPPAAQSSVQNVPPPPSSSAHNVPPVAQSSVQEVPAQPQSSVREVPPAAPAPAAPSGGMDTDAIRRAWPEVLGRIFGMRRATWTFVSQNAQVVAFDGNKLTLGIATVGLTNTFRAGNHSDIVRQALIDELGIDAVVDGVPQPEGGAGRSPSAPPTGAAEPSPSWPEPGAGPRDAGSTGSPAVSRGPGPSEPSQPPRSHASPGGPTRGQAAPTVSSSTQSAPSPTVSGQFGAGRPRVTRSLEDNAGWGSVSTPAPEWATAAAVPAAVSPAVTTATAAVGVAVAAAAPEQARRSPAPTRGGASAVRESLGAARRAGSTASTADVTPVPASTDDSAVSEDDEVIEVSTDVGRAVIEKVLGGRVISETDD